jgi:hypothetical protein
MAVQLVFVESAPQLLKGPRPCGSDPAERNSRGVGHVGVGPRAVGEQRPQQGPPTRRQFSDELPQRP